MVINLLKYCLVSIAKACLAITGIVRSKPMLLMQVRPCFAFSRAYMCTSAIGNTIPPQWQSLGVSRAELTLDFTLPTGQSFRYFQFNGCFPAAWRHLALLLETNFETARLCRWRKSGEQEYTGVICDRLVLLLPPAQIHAFLSDCTHVIS